jgi:hypothetical protein
VSRRKRRKGGERKEGRKEVVGQNIQNKSPSTDPASAFPSAPFAFFKIPHNQAGYSPSSNATGSFFPFTKFKPLSVVPAATELFTVGAAFSALLGAWREAAEGDALKGVEKGCAAPVDVAAGGVCEEELSGLPVRGEAVERRGVVVVRARRKGRMVGRWMAVRRQRVQIIVCVVVVRDGDLDFEVLLCAACDWDKDSMDGDAPRLLGSCRERNLFGCAFLS